MTAISGRILPLWHFDTLETFRRRCQLITLSRQNLPSRLMSGLRASHQPSRDRTWMHPTMWTPTCSVRQEWSRSCWYAHTYFDIYAGRINYTQFYRVLILQQIGREFWVSWHSASMVHKLLYLSVGNWFSVIDTTDILCYNIHDCLISNCWCSLLLGVCWIHFISIQAFDARFICFHFHV